nr:transposase domain protein [Rhodococcus sp. JVH1]
MVAPSRRALVPGVDGHNAAARWLHSVPDLIDSIQDYLDPHNDHPHAYVWTATAHSILTKVARLHEKIS